MGQCVASGLVEVPRVGGDQDAGEFRDGEGSRVRITVQEIGDGRAGFRRDRRTLEEARATTENQDGTGQEVCQQAIERTRRWLTGHGDGEAPDFETDIQESEANVESPVEFPGRFDEFSGQTVGAWRLGKDDDPHVRQVLRPPGDFVHVCPKSGADRGTGYNPWMLEKEIERVLFSADEIRARVRELAAEIRYRLGDGELVAVGVLTGAFVFLADLVRELGGEVRIVLVRASSYRDGTRPGEISVEIPGETDFEGGDILLVEDIVDTGQSLKALKHTLLERRPGSLTTVALLDKPDRRRVEITADVTGFTVPDEFLVGYGLDYAGLYRNLPDVCVLARCVYEDHA